MNLGLVRAFFDEYQIVFANTKQLIHQVFSIRHQVYCEEYHYEREAWPGMEVDVFDAYSHHFLIKHVETDQYVGTIRTVLPQYESEQGLPMQQYTALKYQPEQWNPNLWSKPQVAEISRLAVLKQYRSIGLKARYLSRRMRQLPIVVIALYVAVAAEYRLSKQRQFLYLTVQTRLARHLKMVGVCFEQIGDEIDCRGPRAPFVLRREVWNTGFRGEINDLFTTVINKLEDENIAQQGFVEVSQNDVQVELGHENRTEQEPYISPKVLKENRGIAT
ncbi:PEP-CTERM/exosortase system-associated acyltransferase [Echinimonas agarilytica]|uniref:PEP-CTERM/exosortase system-associated acyltransferase n=1 Tax=Echinimonas agarilytica TaxID=1215918 RepID=A0AA42B7I9_9GAMM|nr:PEP-CTERM/exosortase system-associated acyltransferase [Echinimonas agarilytica]MCM2679388.1 PEP-CTERM/exosortase system-associated acyltransferase [Echinimonas agarilytica]